MVEIKIIEIFMFIFIKTELHSWVGTSNTSDIKSSKEAQIFVSNHVGPFLSLFTESSKAFRHELNLWAKELFMKSKGDLEKISKLERNGAVQPLLKTITSTIDLVVNTTLDDNGEVSSKILILNNIMINNAISNVSAYSVPSLSMT